MNSGYGQTAALIRYFFKVDPDELSDEQFVRLSLELNVVTKALNWEQK